MEGAALLEKVDMNEESISTVSPIVEYGIVSSDILLELENRKERENGYW